MSKNTTNLLGIVIAIVAGTYFNLMLCNTCITNTEAQHRDLVKNKKLAEKKMTI